MSADINRCDEVLELDLKLASGAHPAEEQKKRVEEHLSTCERCAIEREALDLLADEDGGIPQLDDLAQRRFIKDVLSRAEKEPYQGCEGDLSEGQDLGMVSAFDARSGRRLSVPSLAVGAICGAIAAAVVFLVFMLWPAETTTIETVERPIEPRQPSAPISAARLVLGDSTVTIDDRPAKVGDDMTTGQRITTHEGPAGLRFGDGQGVLLMSETRVIVDETSDRGTIIELKRGRIVASVPPLDEARFSVSTGQGLIKVRGTIFAVGMEEHRVKVEVLRGQVELQTKSGPTVVLDKLQVAFLDEPLAQALSADARSALWSHARALDAFDARSLSTVTITSEPEGASVMIDDIPIAPTPLTVNIRPGHHLLTLSIDERPQYSDVLDIRSGERIEHFVDLTDAVGEESDVEPADTIGGANDLGSPTVSAEELLRKAQEFRGRRDFPQAAQAYRQLLKRYPNTGSSRAAMLSLAHLALEQLHRPGEALRLFDRYLQRDQRGPLSQEALYGKSRALRALGRRNEERATLELFLSRFPSVVQSGQARRRLDELSGIDDGQEGDLEH